MFIKVNKLYYAGKNEEITKKQSQGQVWYDYGGYVSLPIFTKSKENACEITNVIDLKRIFNELVDAIRFKDIFENEKVERIEVLYDL